MDRHAAPDRKESTKAGERTFDSLAPWIRQGGARWHVAFRGACARFAKDDSRRPTPPS
jgi:hypothetical protein